MDIRTVNSPRVPWLSLSYAMSKDEALSLSQLEQQLTEIDAELEQLANFTVRGGAGSLGYHSKTQPQPDSTESIPIELGEAFAVDKVVLVPALYRDADSGLHSRGFPSAFRILANMIG